MSSIIKIENFTFKYLNQSEAVLKNINLDIKRGEKVLIAGPSGSGKSTLGACFNGIIPFSKPGIISGKLTINGDEPYKKSIFENSKNVGTILQDQDNQFIGLTVGEDVSFSDENKAIEINEMKKNTDQALEMVKISKFKDYSPQELSGGQKQSVSLASILRSSADILLFDEPLANLDPKSGRDAMRLINEIHREYQKTIIIIEHRIEDVLEQEFDRVVIVNDGEIVANDSPKELFRKDLFSKYGLRVPLYVEALKYSGVDLETGSIYPLAKIATDENIESVKKWIESIQVKKASSSEEILNVIDLEFSYDDENKILNKVNFNLKKGEILGLLGNNGAGKSTLCKVIVGIEKATSGDITLLDKSINSLSIKKRGERIGFVMQNPNHMITQETLLQEVEFGLKIRGVKDSRAIAEKTLEICDLKSMRNWPVTALSYGQKKRLTIASILALDPEILILDEPTAAQDYKHYKEFMKFIKKLADKGVSIILITHDMHLALEYADRAIVLCNGEVIAIDAPANILENSDIMEKSNLKETSLSEMGKIMGIDPTLLMNSFINYEHKEEEKNV